MVLLLIMAITMSLVVTHMVMVIDFLITLPIHLFSSVHHECYVKSAQNLYLVSSTVDFSWFSDAGVKHHIIYNPSDLNL